MNDRLGARPGYVCAYLAGSLNRLALDAPVPDSTDVDVHIVYRARGAWAPAEVADGLLLQCTVQDIDLASADAVLARPFESEPLRFGAILADPRSALVATRADRP